MQLVAADPVPFPGEPVFSKAARVGGAEPKGVNQRWWNPRHFRRPYF